MNRRRIWTNYPPLGPTAEMLAQRLGDQYDLVVGKPKELAGASIAFGQPDPGVLIQTPEMKWVHVNTAGYTNYDTDAVRDALRSRGGVLSNSSSIYCEPCAQHVLALMLAMVRKIPQSLENQRTRRAWPANELRGQSILLNHQHVLLIGFGAIGKRVAELLAPFQVDLVVVRKSIRGNESYKTITANQLNEFLPWADHVVNVLPSSSSTTQLFDADRLKRMKKTAIFYNIGRGDTVDQTALRAMLETDSLAGAFLDVMMPEPLPPDDPLWTTPHCYISPHTAGGHHNEVERIVNHFLNNLERFNSGKPLADRIF